MKQKFTCPNCGTGFRVDLPEGVPLVLCPTCGTNIPVIVDEVGTISDNLRHAATREGNWILWAAAAFAVVWGLVVLVMVLSSRKSAPAVVSSSPPVVVPPAAPPAPTIFTMPDSPPPPPMAITRTPSPKPIAPTPTSKPAEPLRLVPRRAAVTDAEIVGAIHKGIDFLLTQFVNGEINPKMAEELERQGVDALAVYALLHCSQSTRDDRLGVSGPLVKPMIERLKKYPMVAPSESGQPITYARSLRASALSVYNRPEDREKMAADLAWLLHAEEGGAFGYDDVFLRPSQQASKLPPSPPGMHAPGPFAWDNSNSQYGLIGVWNLAETGLTVPLKFWQDVERHWLTCQNPNGTWGYRPGEFGPAMTMAGITALSVTRDFQGDAATQPSVGSRRIPPRNEALNRAIDWFEHGDNCLSRGSYVGYSMYGLERAALASGMMFAGTHDIYREVAGQLVRNQNPSGAWIAEVGPQAVIETSFALLFLARGRNPVLLNKLRYDGNWANHQRDAANLARYATYAMERPINWQAVSLAQPWGAWMEAPILYIAGDVPPTFGPADYDRLKNYVDNGGLIFTHADNGSEVFNEFARDLARKLFPKYEMGAISDEDDLWSLQFQISAPHPRLLIVSNGSRKLMIHCTEDLAGRWQASNPKRNQAAFELGLNLFIYATGKAQLRTKTDSSYIPAPSEAAGKVVPVARIQYAGNWDPEPAAWARFVRYFWWETGYTLQPVTVAIGDLNFKDYAIASLTGTTSDPPSDAGQRAMKQFVQDGGTLIIDSCGGSRRFADVLKQSWLPAIAPGVTPHVLAEDDPILTGKISGIDGDSELPRVLIRPYTAQVSKPKNTHLMEIKSGKGRVLYTEIDITTGLLGTNIWGITGYSPAYAQALLKNVILHTMANTRVGE